jgi:polar amino acid transport system substrate-binding protein
MLRRSFLAAGAVATGATLFRSRPAHAAPSTLEKARSEGYVTMGFTNELPYSYAVDGKLTGVDVEVARHVLNQLGIRELVGVLTEFQSLIPGLRARRFDINSTMYVTPARCKQILFTNPVWAVSDGVIVAAGNPKGITSFQSIAAKPSLRIGYLAGAELHAVMLKMGVKEEQMTAFPDQPSAIAALQADRVDGFANTSQGNAALLAKVADPKLAKAAPFEQAVIDGKPLISFGALGFRVQDAAFHKAFNEALSGFIGTPEHLAMVKPFGFTEDEILPAAKAKIGTLCAA